MSIYYALNSAIKRLVQPLPNIHLLVNNCHPKFNFKRETVQTLLRLDREARDHTHLHLRSTTLLHSPYESRGSAQSFTLARKERSRERGD